MTYNRPLAKNIITIHEDPKIVNDAARALLREMCGVFPNQQMRGRLIARMTSDDVCTIERMSSTTGESIGWVKVEWNGESFAGSTQRTKESNTFDFRFDPAVLNFAPTDSTQTDDALIVLVKWVLSCQQLKEAK